MSNLDKRVLASPLFELSYILNVALPFFFVGLNKDYDIVEREQNYQAIKIASMFSLIEDAPLPWQIRAFISKFANTALTFRETA